MKRIIILILLLAVPFLMGAGQKKGGGTGEGLSANAVEESHLKAINEAADGECLSFDDQGGGDFEWVACGGEVEELIGTTKDLRVSTVCNSGFYYDLNGDDSQDAGEPCGGRDGIFYANEYAVGSDTGGIQEAVDAACDAGTAGAGVVEFTGDIVTTVPIELDCDRVGLRGGSGLDSITWDTAETGIIITGDGVSLQDFSMNATAPGHASDIAIDMDNGVDSVSDWSIKNVNIQGGAGKDGIGVNCHFCMKGSMVNSKIHTFDTGMVLEEHDETHKPNANSVTGSVIRDNTSYGIQITSLSAPFSIQGSTLEANGIGISCTGTTGFVRSSGNHYENTGTAQLERPANGCGFISIGDKMSGSATIDFSKGSSGATEDVFIGTYWNNGISVSGSECVAVLYPANIGSAELGSADPTDVCMVSIEGNVATWTVEGGVNLTVKDMSFEGATVNDFETTVAVIDPTQDNTLTVPDSDQTIGTATTVANDTVSEDAIDACELGGGAVSILEFDDAGNPTCKESVKTTISGDDTDGDMLVWDTNAWKDVPMGGDATMNAAGEVTIGAGKIHETMMAAEDFGDFTCGGGATDCDINENVVDMTAISDSINFVTTGTIRGDIHVTVTADTVLSPEGTALRGNMHFSNHASGTDYTLPDISGAGGTGMSACFYDLATTGADLIVIDPAAGDNFILDGAALGNGDELHSPADPGDFICILAIDATTWITLGRSGTWVNGDI